MFHQYTPYLKLGRFRVQFSMAHLNGKSWDGSTGPNEHIKLPFLIVPRISNVGISQAGVFITKSCGIAWGRWSLSIQVCNTKRKAVAPVNGWAELVPMKLNLQ